MEIRAFTIKFASKLKKERDHQNEHDLNLKLNKLINKNPTQAKLEEISTIKKELEAFENFRIKGSILRLKSQWAEEWEKEL